MSYQKKPSASRTPEDIMKLAVSPSGYIEKDCGYLLFTGWDNPKGNNNPMRDTDKRGDSNVKIGNPRIRKSIQGY